MACFLVPVAEAVITTIASKVIEKKEKSRVNVKLDGEQSADGIREKTSVPFSRKLRWLGNLLWGGSALLAFEHVWHGEVVPWFPFLTAAADPADAVEMLHEMATVGVTMTLLVTAVWLGMLAVSSAIEKRAEKTRSVNE
ncbi:MAG: hypothetical protein IKX19_09775 [Clostridia bacterium]|nr:hypothetical protein [Clostridia bacterium]